MTIEVEDRSGVAIVRLHGDLTAKDGGKFVKAVTDLLDRGTTRVVLDLAHVAMVTSAGLGELVHVTAQANTQGGHIVLANVMPFVAGVLETTKLNAFLETYPDVDGAVAKLR
ncbi:MAG TPA: STAS domain-containing protein [Phycisphaerae bacterium]|nr:STAS domain-containing protein [Phycisphaerae bacterium]